jgi:hypothetical protein
LAIQIYGQENGTVVPFVSTPEMVLIWAPFQQAHYPVPLPSPDEVIGCFDRLRDLMARDPLLAREKLRNLFSNRRLLVQPGKPGFVVVKGEILPLALLSLPPVVEDRAVLPSNGSGGRI